MMTVGKRNLLERIARSRMADDAFGAVHFSALVVGLSVIVLTVIGWISGR